MDQVLKIDTPLFLEAPIKPLGSLIKYYYLYYYYLSEFAFHEQKNKENLSPSFIPGETLSS